MRSISNPKWSIWENTVLRGGDITTCQKVFCTLLLHLYKKISPIIRRDENEGDCEILEVNIQASFMLLLLPFVSIDS